VIDIYLTRYVSNILTILTQQLFTELGTPSFFPGSLSAKFLSIDCYRSIAHFANFHHHRSITLKKTSGLLLEKSAKTLDRSWNYSGLLFLKFAPSPPSVNKICMYSVKEKPPSRRGEGGRQFKYTQLMKQRRGKIEKTTIAALRHFSLKYVQIMHFYAFFDHFYSSIFEIAQLLFAFLERTLILGVKERFKKKSNKRTDKIKFWSVRSWAI